MNILQSLSSIVKKVNAAADLQSALEIIVNNVRAVMGTEVCTVYLVDRNDRLVFRATEGLNKAVLGTLSLGFGEGLVGQVALREEPINTSEAKTHPYFQYFSEIGEDAYSSFLGVPIIHHRVVLGVLVVQQKQSRRFDDSEEAFLVTVSAQLAGLIAHAQVAGLIDLQADARAVNAEFKGVPGAAGISIGRAVVVTQPADLYAVPPRKSRDCYEELVFFRACVARVRSDIAKLSSQLADRLSPQELALFDVYSKMLDPPALPKEIEQLIEEGEWAQGAVAQVIRSHLQTFDEMESPYLKERAVDVKDLGSRLLEYLQQANHEPIAYPEKTILIGDELTASMLGDLPREKLVGLISLRGSHNSHVAILARGMGIPTVMGAKDIPFTQVENSELIVDGYSGLVYFNPSKELFDQYQEIVLEENQVSKGLEELKDLNCETTDGHRVSLWVNTGLASDHARSIDRGAEGVGLYRTEIPFIMKDRFPSEEEQRIIYRRQLDAFAPNPVTMRTLDIGGDKSLSYFPINEDNPFLGWRGIRITLDHPELFLSQVRAMMKASIDLNNLRILLPMISHIKELNEAIDLISRAHRELLEEGFDIQFPMIGVMIEVPAAVYLSEQFSQRVDFLSVGSNDLTQYLLAVDRNNPNVAELYDSYHPAVLQALMQIAEVGKKVGKPTSICGELAGDPGAAILLMGMGYNSLSMNATNLPKVKYVLRTISKIESKNLLSQVIKLSSAEDVHQKVEEFMELKGISRLFSDRIKKRELKK
jgi:phosphotransferase system enzyme I (PtsP)